MTTITPLDILRKNSHKALNVSHETVKKIISVIFVPWWVTSEPIAEILTAGAAADEKTKSWADRKLSEHSFVGITVRLKTSETSRKSSVACIK